MGSQRKAGDGAAVPIRFVLHEVEALLPVPDAVFQAAGKDGRGAGWTGRAFLHWKRAGGVPGDLNAGGFSPEEKIWVVGTSALCRLPARAMMVRSSAATTTVTPMGIFLSLMHLRLKSGEKAPGRGTAGRPVPPRAPQAPHNPSIPPCRCLRHPEILPQRTLGGAGSDLGAFIHFRRIFRAA